MSVCCKPINTLRKKLWIEPNRPAYLAIEDLIHQRQLLLAKSLATQRDFLVIQPWISVLPKIRWFRHSLAVGSCWTFHVCACIYIYACMKKTIHTCTTVRTYSYISIYIYIYVCENSYDASPRPSELRTRPNSCGKPSVGLSPYDLTWKILQLRSYRTWNLSRCRNDFKTNTYTIIYIYIWYIYELKCSKKSSVLIYIDTFWVFQQYVRYFWMNMCTSWTTNKKLYIYICDT